MKSGDIPGQQWVRFAELETDRPQRVTPEMLEQQAAMVEMVAGVEANLARIRKAIDKAKPSTPSPAPKE